MSLLSTPEPVPAVLARAHSLLEGPRIGPGGELVYSDVLAGGDVLISTADNDVDPALGGTLLLARSEVAGQPVAPARI